MGLGETLRMLFPKAGGADAPERGAAVEMQSPASGVGSILEYLQNRDRARYSYYPQVPSSWDVREARFIASETSYGRRYLELASDNALGADGLRLMIEPNVVAQAWDDWGMMAGLDGETFGEMQERALVALLRDGEILTEMVTRDGSLRVYLHDSLALDYQNGIMFTPDGRPRSYAFRTETADTDARPMLVRSRTVGADAIDHVFRRLTPTQTRGRSWYVPAFHAFRDLSRISGALLDNARAAAAFPGFWTADADYVLTDFVHDAGADDWAGLEADKLDGGKLRETLKRVPQEDQLLPSGTMWNKIERSAGFSLGSDYPGVRAAILAEIASGLGVSYHALTGNVEAANFSSLRHARLSDIGFFQRIQKIMANWTLRVYARWYKMAVSDSRFSVRALRGARTPGVISPSFGYIEPNREASAQKIWVDTGLMSRSEIIRESGRDPETVFAELAEERELLAPPQMEPMNDGDRSDESDAESESDAGGDA